MFNRKLELVHNMFGNTNVAPVVLALRIVESVGESVNEHECVDESEGDGEDGGETEGEFGV